MPEGPETHRNAREIHRALAGRRADEVYFAFDWLAPYARDLAGRTVVAVRARGKAILTEFDGGLAVFSHNQLYGRWYVRRSGSVPRTDRSLRFKVANADHSAFLYSASDIEVLDAGELERQPYLAGLGPDPLMPGVTVADIAGQIRAPAFARRRLAGLLLSPAFVAGVGNYLRSEILFASGLRPELRPRDLTAAQTDRLAAAIHQLMHRSLRTGGITNDEDRAAALEARGTSRREYRHLVFGRDGASCYLCGAPIDVRQVAGRRLYQCPRCQP